MTPSLGFITLLELPTELREIHYLLDHQFTIKGKTQEQPDERDAEGKVEGRVRCLSALWHATVPKPPQAHQPKSP